MNELRINKDRYAKVKKKEKKKGQRGQIVLMAMMMLAGGVCGAGIAHNAKNWKEYYSSGEGIMVIGILLLSLYLVLFIQVVVHEGGHLIAGLLTGYTFSSFRIGSVMFVKKDGNIEIKKHSVAGTGGQCLMSPPNMVDGKIPYVWYNLGGCIANLIVSMICLGFYVVYRDVPIVSVILLEFMVLGLALALTNGIPFQAGMVNNDGYNALSLGKHAQAMRSFWVQMKAIEQIAKGVRLCDMPSDWFVIPSDEGMKNSMVAVMGVFACNRLMDEHKFEEADTTMARLLSMETAIVPIHKNLMICDKIYCELIGENRTDKMKEMETKEFQKFLKSMKNSPSVIRMEYAYALLHERDLKKAQKFFDKFEKVAKTYPYPSDMESERELMEIARTRRDLEQTE